MHISAGIGDSAQSGNASAGTNVGTVGLSKRQSGVGVPANSGNGSGTGNRTGMVLVLGGPNGGNGNGGLSPVTPATAGAASPGHGDLSFTSGGGVNKGSPLSQYATPTTASASPGDPGFSPNVVVIPPSLAGVHGTGLGGGINVNAGGSMSSRSGTPEIPRA
jgi:hypothetical protein